MQFVELDALVHGPGWSEVSDACLRDLVEPIVASEAWVVDGSYERKQGGLVLEAAETIIWLDLPVRVWMPRLVRRSWRRMRRREELWNGNRESLSSLFWGRDSLLVFALRSHRRRRREWPAALPSRTLIRLQSTGDVKRFMTAAAASSLR